LRLRSGPVEGHSVKSAEEPNHVMTRTLLVGYEPDAVDFSDPAFATVTFV